MSQEPDARSFTVEFCYRHPKVQTGVHCTRCGRPICPECMIEAPVGYQCPECVSQARREFKLGPARRARTVAGTSGTKALIAAIVAMFAVEIMVGGPQALTNPSQLALFDLGAMYPPAIALESQYWRLFSSMFLHIGALHLLVNSYALWILGQTVEGRYGRSRLLITFLVTGFVANAVSYAFSPAVMTPFGPVFPVAAGASGGIAGLFGAFLALAYRRRHTAAGAASLQWALTMIVINVVINISVKSLDWRAHLGGLLAGLAAGYLLEGVGPRKQQTLLRILGFSALAGIGIVLVLTRTSELRSGTSAFF